MLGRRVQRVAGLRMAGYPSPNVRLRSERYRDRGAEITDAQREEFADWLRPLVGKVDVVVAHEQGLVETAAEELRRNPPASPLALLTGHTHLAVAQASENLVELNGGSAGGGGTGNLADDQPFGIARLLYETARRLPAAVRGHGGDRRRQRGRPGGAAAGGRRALGAP